MVVNLERARRNAEQLIAFADGYEEAASVIVAAVSGDLPTDVARGARRMRAVAYDLLALADEAETCRLALAEGRGVQGVLWDE